MERRRHFSYTLMEFYREFKVSRKLEGNRSKMTYNEYKAIMTFFLKEIYLGLINGSVESFRMPYALGMFKIRSYKPNTKKHPIDFYQSKIQGKLVRHLNLHTFGYYYGMAWDKFGSRFANSVYYRFKATRTKAATDLGIGKKGLSNFIKEASKTNNKPKYMKV